MTPRADDKLPPGSGADEPAGDTSIAAYRAKRDFAATPEPQPGTFVRPEERPVFVVQRHEARRLHYDLRLEMDGVLRSFAVPKGFSWDPADKHLAVRTEDHPLEYYDFEGVIPKGAYGAGTMTIWDRGTYTLRKGLDGPAAIAKGKLEIAFDGGRLQGEWHMVRTARDERDWLLFKHRDRYAREAGAPLFPLDLSREERRPLPTDWEPAAPGSESPPFRDPDWLFELEFAGRRLLLVTGPSAHFIAPPGAEAPPLPPGVGAALPRLRAETAVLDGVLVAMDEGGRPRRELLEERLAAGGSAVAFYAFDLLYYEAWDLRAKPLELRKRALESIVPRNTPGLLYVDHVAGRGDELAQVVAASGLQGVIAKRRDAPYEGGPQPTWRRVRGTEAETAHDAHVLDQLAAAVRAPETRVKLSNLDKVYWPESGITKGQLLGYYDQVAEVLLPHLRDRPVHMLRYPDGITGKSFYQKDAKIVLPDWVPTAEVAVKDGEPVRYVVCNDRDTLLFLVNLGSIDVHPWMSRVGSLDSPDYAVIDLDPSDDDFAPVIRIARTVGKLLRGAGMRPLLKTSGASGLHVFIPLQPGYTYEQGRIFCEVVARLVVRQHKDIATVERSVGRRGHKVYVDYLQNAREQTVVPAYVVRPKPGATVSAPLLWDELDDDLRREAFTIFTVPDRIARHGDLFRGVLDDPHDILDALGRLEEAASGL